MHSIQREGDSCMWRMLLSPSSPYYLNVSGSKAFIRFEYDRRWIIDLVSRVPHEDLLDKALILKPLSDLWI